MVAALAIGVAMPGCEDQRRHQASEDVDLLNTPAPVAADAPPEVTSKAMLLALQEMQVVRRQGLGVEDNRDRYNRALAEIVSLIDQQRVHENMREPRRRSPLVPDDIERAPALKLVAESWVSMVSHYVDSISPTMKVDMTPVTRGRTAKQQDGTSVQLPDETRAFATLYNERERAIVEEIAADSAIANLKDETGKPVERGSAAWLAAIKPLALERGVHVPVETKVTLHLSRGPEGWRVYRISLDPPAPSAVAARSSARPATATRPAQAPGPEPESLPQ